MARWVPVVAGLHEHPKALHLEALLGIEDAWRFPVRLWMWAATHAESGEITGPIATLIVEKACGWRGRPEVLVRALLDSRWLDEINGGFYIHDWKEHVGMFLERGKAEAERVKAYRERKRKEREDSYANRTRTLPVRNADGTPYVLCYPTQPDPTQPDPTTGSNYLVEFDASRQNVDSAGSATSGDVAPQDTSPEALCGPPEGDRTPPATSPAPHPSPAAPGAVLELFPVEAEAVSKETQVFEYWRRVMEHPRAAFDGKRQRAVKARLADGYSVDDLKRAIDGCAQTPHNMGENERHQRFDDLELICRNAGQVDRFMANAGGLQRAVGDLRRGHARAEDVNHAEDDEAPF